MPAIDWVTETTDGETLKTGQFETRIGLVGGEKRFTIRYVDGNGTWIAMQEGVKGFFASDRYEECVQWCWEQLNRQNVH